VKYLLDTNTCIGWLRANQSNLVARIQQADPQDIALCSVVVAELLYGVERAATAHQANNRLKVEQLRKQFLSFPFDDVAADCYAKIRAHLVSAGTPIGPNDLMIAAIAVAQGLILVTHNTFEFNRVPGLIVEDWQSS
jgi:tRNA(fMet)-specific endonuclease VapC